jgi:hypothetical protein
MDCRFHAIIHFQIQLGKLVFIISRRVLDITQRRGIDNITDNEALDGLVFGDGLASGNASDTLDVSSSVLVAAVIASFYSHDNERV